MPTFAQFFPDVDTLLRLEPEDVGALTLQYLNSLSPGQALHRYNFVSTGFGGELPGYAGTRSDQVQEVLSEGWAWLVREGFLVLSPRDSSNSAYVISRRGQTLRTNTDSEAFKRGSLLGHRTLDPVLAAKVVNLFVRGDYDLAILAAFKEVEVRTRTKANLPAEKIGVDLMREAFHPERGVLANQSLPKGERESRSALFAGAIGTFKNPSSHRNVSMGPEEARELILFANYLLRMVEAP
jgi:uncharacterized protein (TIGR02391 family)